MTARLGRVSAWLRGPERVGDLRRAAGWTLLCAALLPVAFRDGLYLPARLPGAMLLAALTLSFLFLLRPRLGSIHEWRGTLTALVVFATLSLGFSHVLGSAGDWPLARFYQALQAGAARTLSHAVGEGLAGVVVSPLYLLCAMILLFSFAFRSLSGLLFVLALILAQGLYPFRAELAAGYLLWIAGFCLLVEEPLYLPARVRARLPLSPPVRDLLLELRERPLPDSHALFLVCGRPVESGEAVEARLADELRRLGSSGLVAYDPAARTLSASPTLQASATPPGVEAAVQALSLVAQGLLLLLGMVYFAMPVDLLPEALLGPIGLLDDVVLLLFSGLPLGRTLWRKWPGLFRRRILPR